MIRKSPLLILLLLPLLALPACSVGKKRQNDAKVHYMLGISYLQEPNATLALKEFLLAEALNPYDGDIQVALGQAYQVKKAYPEAERHYQRALDLDSGNPLYQNNLAALYLDMQRWDAAIDLFRRAAGNLIFPSSEVALAGMAFAYERKGDQAAAVAAYRQALEHNPRYLLPRLRLGELYLHQGRYDSAQEELNQALLLAPLSAETHYLRGLLYRSKGNLSQAEAAFREALRLAADSEFGRKAEQQLRSLR